MQHSTFLLVIFSAFAIFSDSSPADESTYQRAPEAIRRILDVPPTPTISLAPNNERFLLLQGVRYPPIAELARPMLRIAGLRIDPTTNGPHSPSHYIGLALQVIASNEQIHIGLPGGAKIGNPLWAPDGGRFAFTNMTDHGIDLWVADAHTGKARLIPNVRLNGAYGDAVDWMPDSQTLLCQLIPPERGAPPAASPVPAGPNVQESHGKAGPTRTYQDLLDNPHEEAQFDYYATSQLALVSSADGKISPLGRPAIVAAANVSPDGKLLLVTTHHRPYSYLHPVSDFPKMIAVWNLEGKVVQTVAELPLADRIPIEGVPTGPRNIHWRPTEPATLVWAEALDGGDPRQKVPHRDRILMQQNPFDAPPIELARTEHRYFGLSWTEHDHLALLRDYDRDRRWRRTFLIDASQPGQVGRLIWDHSVRDRYGDPGTPLMRTLSNGHRVIGQDGSNIFLDGEGATPQGDRPFLDRFDLKTGKSERLFRCAEQQYESAVALLSRDGRQFLTRHETPTSPPNYSIRTAGSDERRAVTHFADPAPELRDIKKQLVTYQRADGVPLSFTLYLPPNYKDGQRLPTVVWAYPREFSDAGTAGQVTGSANRFTSISGISHLFLLLAGYAVLDGASMPVVGDPATMNDTYVAQIVSSAQAAIDKAVEMGFADRDRVGVGGHSYGAFMTANLLAHCDLFRAGVARSGAYNRSLTPFGFQSERRTLWEAPETYMKVSPLFLADKINEPLLLIHGEADNNPGTFPVQSERMYQAVRGNGGTARLVMLPHESHGYSARESIEHTLYEMIAWFDKHVKNASSRSSTSAATSSTSDLHELESIALEELKASKTPGAAVAVVRQGEVVFAKGFGTANVETGTPVEPEMLFRLGSTTKMFTAAALVSLAEEGKLKLDEPIARYVSGLNPRIGELTSHQLLTHTAGLTDESIMSGLHDDSALRRGIEDIHAGWFFTEPGRIYSYSNPGFWIAGLVCESVSNQPYADVMSEQIFRPLEMKRSTLRPTEAMTWPVALGHEVRAGKPQIIRPQADNAATWPAGQIYSSVIDLARFTTAIMNRGELDRKQVLSEETVRQLTTPYVEVPGSANHYGYGLVVSNDRGVRILQHNGSRSGYGSTIRMAPDQQVAVIILTNRSGSSLPRTAAKALELTLPLKGHSARPTGRKSELSADEMNKIAGTYTNHRQTVELTAMDGRLVMRRLGGEGNAGATNDVTALDKNTLLYDSGNSNDGAEPMNRIIIVRDKDGAAEYICLSGRALRRRTPEQDGKSKVSH